MRGLRLVVRSAESDGSSIRVLCLQDEDGWTLPPFQPGAHIDVHLPDGQSRCYSLCNDPAEDDRYVIAVKLEPDGRGGSRFLHEGVQAGEAIEVSLPRNVFALAPDAARHVFIAGGIGVTPFLSMARALLRQSAANFHLHVLFRARPPLARLMAPLLAAGRATLHDTSGGRPSITALLGPFTAGAHAYACGPAGMMEAIAAWPEANRHVEHFVPPELPPDPDARDFTLVLARSGRRITVDAGVSVLTALRRLGVAVDSSCEGGICGACRVAWTEGEPVHRDRVLSPQERATTLISCVAGSAGKLLVVDL
jgi:vanillate O-demethylase ferredoxin subunit